MAHPPLPHAITGSVSFAGKALRSAGRKTTRPGVLNAGSGPTTLYGPGTASGAPSTGSALAIISRVTPGGCARLGAASPRRTAIPQMNETLIFMSEPQINPAPRIVSHCPWARKDQDQISVRRLDAQNRSVFAVGEHVQQTVASLFHVANPLPQINEQRL